ncbi:MAG: hypothetical protein JWP69_2256 [Flaviaesturariibacter sp.]|nr:hypothetical protein [Flaviaesturariibacter sp.]
MHSEEWVQNNNAAQKLEGLASLPDGFRFNQPAVWEKLEAHLQPAQKRRTVSRWWAAAVLLLSLTATWFFIQKGDKSKAVMAESKPKKGVQTPVIVATTIGKNIGLTEKKTGRPVKSVLFRVAAKALPAADLAKETTLAIATDSFPATGSAIPSLSTETVITSIPKPRFRIAHTNELRRIVWPAETLNEATKPAYSFLRRPVYNAAADEPATVEEQPLKKHPKTLIGLLNTSQ